MFVLDPQVKELAGQYPELAAMLRFHIGEYTGERGDVPGEYSLRISLVHLDDAEAAGLVARENNYDGDIYRHWEYVSYDAIMPDGTRQSACVPVGQSLAEALTRMPVRPALIVEVDHLSGQCGPGDQYGHSEGIRILHLPPSPGPAQP